MHKLKEKIVWVLPNFSDKPNSMVLEIDRQTLFPYLVYDEPVEPEKAHAYPYDAVAIIERVFSLLDPDNIFKRHAIDFYEKAVGNSEYRVKPPEIAADCWNNANALINRLISIEETRITDNKSWQELKNILITRI